jgi:hypothetical protein
MKSGSGGRGHSDQFTIPRKDLQKMALTMRIYKIFSLWKIALGSALAVNDKGEFPWELKLIFHPICSHTQRSYSYSHRVPFANIKTHCSETTIMAGIFQKSLEKLPRPIGIMDARPELSPKQPKGSSNQRISNKYENTDQNHRDPHTRGRNRLGTGRIRRSGAR